MLTSGFRGFDVFDNCNGCGQRGYGDDTSGSAGGATTGASSGGGITPLRSIAIGLTTGLTLWFVTRILDKHLGGK